MAWIVGLASPSDLLTLEERGWCPVDDLKELIRDVVAEPLDDSDDQMVAFYVDTDLFKVMSGPDWEGGETGQVPRGLTALEEELLEALENAASFFEDDGYNVDELRAVIAKAKEKA